MLAFRLKKHLERISYSTNKRWINLYDHFYDMIHNKSRRSLGKIKVPKYYKDLRLAEIKWEIRYIGRDKVTILGKEYKIAQLSIAKLTSIIAENQGNDKIQGKWEKWEVSNVFTKDAWINSNQFL
ncbi:MAG: hypothetical protein AAF489_17195 [Bacteroidota bacterium]